MNEKIYYTYENLSDYNNQFILKEKYRPYKNCFPTKSEAIEHFQDSFKLAKMKHYQVISKLEEIKKLVSNFSFNCYATAHDDSGLEAYKYIKIIVNGYEFKFEIEE